MKLKTNMILIICIAITIIVLIFAYYLSHYINYKEMAHDDTVILLSFEEFERYYHAIPDNFSESPYYCLMNFKYKNHLTTISFSTFRDFLKYQKWINRLEKQKKNNRRIKNEKVFYEELLKATQKKREFLDKDVNISLTQFPPVDLIAAYIASKEKEE